MVKLKTTCIRYLFTLVIKLIWIFKKKAASLFNDKSFDYFINFNGLQHKAIVFLLASFSIKINNRYKKKKSYNMIATN